MYVFHDAATTGLLAKKDLPGAVIASESIAEICRRRFAGIGVFAHVWSRRDYPPGSEHARQIQQRRNLRQE
jgi:hypothetical protein